MHRPLPGDARIVHVVIKRTARGWYAVLMVEYEIPDPVPRRAPAAGVDVGVVHLVALSTGEVVPAPRWYRRAEVRLAEAQRALSRARRGTRAWERARRRLARLHAHVAACRRDFLHKLSRRLVRAFGIIAVEDDRVRRLARSAAAKGVLDAAWGSLVAMLDYKAAEAGGRVVRVDPRGTSTACARCGTDVPKDTSVRVHRCPVCGLVLDRDVNAACNILHRALSVLHPARTGPMRCACAAHAA